MPFLLRAQTSWDFTTTFLDDDIYPTAIIALPFPVQKTIINMYKVGDANGSRMLYVELCAVDYNDYKVAAKSDLVMID
jgi:hypothetical protein